MEWVKLHLSWADGLDALTDDDDQIDEAACGRFILGLMKYIKTGERPKMTGPEKVLFNIAVADLKKDYTFFEKAKNDEEAKRQAVSEARRDAANVRWGRTAERANDMQTMQTDANASKDMQEHTEASNEEQTVQIAPNKNKSKSKNIEPEKEIEKEKNKKKKDGQTARSQKPVTEARYDQRPNTEPDGSAMPQWLQDYQSEITGYSDPEGNPDAPDRPDIHNEG